MFIFLRNCQTVLHSAKPFLFSYHSVRELLSSKRSSHPATSDSFSFLTFIKVCRNISLHFVFSFFQWLILFFFSSPYIKVVSWNSHMPILFVSSLFDHSPSLPEIQCLESYHFIYLSNF